MSEAVFKLHIEALKEGGYLATSTALPGLVAQGRTIGETLEIAQDVTRKLVESYGVHGDRLPYGLKQVQKKGLDIGKFLYERNHWEIYAPGPKLNRELEAARKREKTAKRRIKN